MTPPPETKSEKKAPRAKGADKRKDAESPEGKKPRRASRKHRKSNLLRGNGVMEFLHQRGKRLGHGFKRDFSSILEDRLHRTAQIARNMVPAGSHTVMEHHYENAIKARDL